MIGMIGEALDDKIQIDTKVYLRRGTVNFLTLSLQEVADAQWFSKKDVAVMFDRSLVVCVFVLVVNSY